MARSKRKSDAHQPWVDNYPPLAEWLKKHEAICLRQLSTTPQKSEPDSYLEEWSINGRAFWIEVLDRGRGWEIFTTVDTNSIEDTLEHAELTLGIAL